MDFDATFQFIKIEIDKQINGRPNVPDGYIEEFISEYSDLKDLINDEMKKKLIRHLEAVFWTKHDDGHSLTNEITPWYQDRLVSVDFRPYYWERLKKYWHDHGLLPKDSIRSTDKVTDEIMDYLGDPHNLESWHRRGLVMGHVQSGKTTNYSALITKAADAGYRIIIVLAGITNSLRKQTQERLDKSFVGKSSLEDEFNKHLYPISRVFSGVEGYSQTPKHPYCGTTQQADFSVERVRGTSASEGNFADPVLFVTKKHQSVLATLTGWLKSLRQEGLLEGPMLLVDDEADNASVNTADNEAEVSRINQRVRELLGSCRRTAYVGYTATPFANIFIHPESNDEMLKEDLFPRHFIKSLDPPSNYIGAVDLFQEEGKHAETCVQEIPEDYLDILPLKHKSSQTLSELPPSLVDAVLEYFLFRAIRILDGEDKLHSSMMINVSRFNNVQEQVADLVEELRKTSLDAANVWGKSSSWEESHFLLRIKTVWQVEYSELVNHSWDQIRQELVKAITPIEVRMVNMKGKGLDYSSIGNSPVHLIAVGGLALSRGLTLEGLAVSYVLRNVGAADTLLQMGRWFGYRSGYEKLCRIHLTPEMHEHFTEISSSVEELRNDLERMEKMRMTPYVFGLKVRQSDTGLAITAANKMRSASEVLLAANYSLKHVQGFEIIDNDDVNQSNLKKIQEFYNELTKHVGETLKYENGALIWDNVDAARIVSLLTQVQLPGLPFTIMGNNRNLISDYISDRAIADGELSKWVVAIPCSASSKGRYGSRIRLPFETNLGTDYYCRQRFSAVRHPDNENIIKITRKNVVAAPIPEDLVYGENIDTSIAKDLHDSEKYSFEEAHLFLRKKPFLLIHAFQLQLDEVETKKSLRINNNQPVISLSCGFIGTKLQSKEHRYAATVRLIEQMNRQKQELDSDEELAE